MNLRTFPPVILAAALLAACSGGGGPNSTPSQSGASASGMITIARPASASSHSRKPAYISSGTTRAALFIDGQTSPAGTSSACTTGCTIAYTTTSGTHTFTAETDNGSKVLGDGTTGAIGIVAGPGNNFTITLNGAAAQMSWVSNTSSNPAPPAQPTSVTANWAIADSAGVDITNAPATATFSGGTITFAVSTSGTVTGGPPTFSPTTLTHPDANGNDYSITAACNGATGSGTFNITATSASVSSLITASELAGLSISYPSASLTVTPSHPYTCTSGVISDSSGGGTLQ